MYLFYYLCGVILNKIKNILVIQTVKEDVLTLNDWIIDAIQDIKGKNIIKLDLRKIDDAPADYFIICEGDSVTQIKAISDNISKKIYNEMGISANHIEGFIGAKWILVDFFDTIVHVFYPETRMFYEIEELWSDAKITEYLSN
jgi:ribosome-associated protein